ncbi:hypothetical protein MHZ92_18020 [Sporosarcina sp. ACRSL]|uniref:hypothetical protein n=1 Tax=Sporosarcina sp. ACRSL TaxID=2918215 RepID=UPI001EF5A608|nr:hypothetical protein [Sporosarcina sp. ACRSL]MCG7346013.1 hypothetical protein [Sporosarcina sp. ACRSL]
MRELQFVKALRDLENTKIGLFLSNHHLVEGDLLAVKQDHLVIEANQNVHYIALHHIKALSKNTKDYNLTSATVPFLDIQHFSDILNAMKYTWVTINGTENDGHFGVLNRIAENYIILINHAELFYIPISCISNIHGLVSEHQIHLANQKEQLTNQKRLSAPIHEEVEEIEIHLPEVIQDANIQLDHKPKSLELLLLEITQQPEVLGIYGLINKDEENELQAVNNPKKEEETKELSNVILEESKEIQVEELVEILDQSPESQEEELIVVVDQNPESQDELPIVELEESKDAQDEELIVVMEQSKEIQEEESIVGLEESKEIQEEVPIVVLEDSKEIQDEELIVVLEQSPVSQEEESIVVSEESKEIQEEVPIVVLEESQVIQHDEQIVVSEESKETQDQVLIILEERPPIQEVEQTVDVMELHMEDPLNEIDPELLEGFAPQLVDYDEEYFGELDVWGELQSRFNARKVEPFSFTEPLAYEKDFPLSFWKSIEVQQTVINLDNNAKEEEFFTLDEHSIQLHDNPNPVELLNPPMVKHHSTNKLKNDDQAGFLDEEFRPSTTTQASITSIKMNLKDEKAMLEKQFFSLAKHASSYLQSKKRKHPMDSLPKSNETFNEQYISLMNHATKMYQQLLDK